MPLRGKAAEPYDKWTLYMLKFETHMRMKAQAPAISTLRDAQALTDDPKKLNWCKAIDLLIKRSKNFAYQPMPAKKDKPPAIDIVMPESRQTALQALLADELAVVTPKVNKALDGQTLEGIAMAIKALEGFDILESAAGSVEESEKMISELRSRGIALMGKALQRMQAAQDRINRSANELIRKEFNQQMADGSTQLVIKTMKRGLAYTDQKDLKEIIKTSEELIPNLKGLAKATGGQVREVEDLIFQADELRKKADRTLNDDSYGDAQIGSGLGTGTGRLPGNVPRR
jgi:hypothetical protein